MKDSQNNSPKSNNVVLTDEDLIARSIEESDTEGSDPESVHLPTRVRPNPGSYHYHEVTPDPSGRTINTEAPELDKEYKSNIETKFKECKTTEEVEKTKLKLMEDEGERFKDELNKFDNDMQEFLGNSRKEGTTSDQKKFVNFFEAPSRSQEIASLTFANTDYINKCAKDANDNIIPVESNDDNDENNRKGGGSGGLSVSVISVSESSDVKSDNNNNADKSVIDYIITVESCTSIFDLPSLFDDL